MLYYAGTNVILDRIFSEKNGLLSGKYRLQNTIQPWIFIAPALFFLGVYLVYPVYETLRLSFFNFGGFEFVGLKNYLWAYQDPEFQQAVLNNLLWLLFVPTLCVILGLITAKLADNLRWGTIAKSLIFMPMAISFVGASVILKFVYDYR